MLEVLPQTRGRYIALRLSGSLSHEDHETLIGLVKRQLEEHPNLRLLIEFDHLKVWGSFPNLHEWREELAARKHYEKVALVGDRAETDRYAWLLTTFTSSIVETFPADQVGEAWRWLHDTEWDQLWSWSTMGHSVDPKSEK